MERKLAAILAADVVGYTRLMAADEAGTLERLTGLREAILEPIIGNHNGRVIRLMGDGFLVAFDSAVDAVACAIAWQSALPEARDYHEFSFRIGVHLGDIIVRDGDIFGDGVNVAARLEAAGAAGHVLISDAMYRQISGRIDAQFHDNGPVELKNIPEPVRLWSWPETLEHLARLRQADRKPGICLEPFEARGPEADELAEAIQDDLSTAFARQSGINLVTNGSEADYAVIGSVRGKQGRWRVSASVKDVANGQLVWSERFDETGDDVFDIQDRCVARIAGAVRIRIPSFFSHAAARKSLAEMTVQDLLNHAMNRHFIATGESWNDAASALRLVLERDGGNWMAMTMLSFNTFTKARIFDWRRLSEACALQARDLIERAHRLKPDSEVVRMVHGAYFLFVARDHVAARIEAEEALRLNPDYYHSLDLMAQIELFSGDPDRASELALRAVDCDPGYPYLHLYQRSLGYVQLVRGDYASATGMFRRADRAAPTLPQNLIGIAVSAQLGGDEIGAQQAMGSLRQLVPEFNLAEYEPWPFSNPSDWMPISAALAAIATP